MTLDEMRKLKWIKPPPLDPELIELLHELNKQLRQS